MNPSENLVAFVEQSEGFRPDAYWDVNGWAIGYGTHDPSVIKGTVWSQEQAHNTLRETLAAISSVIDRLVKVPLTQGQFDALCDFCYNLGSGRLAESTLLKLLNLKEYSRAGQELLKWDMNQGRHDAGLKARREAEL